MIQKKVDYKITSALGNQIHLKESDLDKLTILEREGDNVVFLYKDQRYEAKLLMNDDGFKVAKMIINDQTIDLTLKDELDQLVDEMGLSEIVDDQGGDIISPMPGLVVKMLVKVGDSIEKGESVLVLEAMKMENLLQADSTGIVKAIKCKEGDSVNKGDLLVQID